VKWRPVKSSKNLRRWTNKPSVAPNGYRLPKYDFTYKALNRTVGKALHTYNMIGDGDRIAVGLSGGKDSWAMLFVLAERMKRVPVKYSISAIHVDPGFGGSAAATIEDYTRQMGVEIRIEYTDFGVVAHSPVNRENPCFLCARRRRQRLFEVAAEFGCNKLALGHHKDDLIETLLLNMLYSGEISTMIPYQSFFNGKLTVIRPMAYTDEASLDRFAQHMKWPIIENLCPSAGRSKRAEIKEMLNNLYRSNKKIRGNLFRAMHHIKADYLLKP
jgi:tRNA 2-thiocytidine biosynthesis protein TtcA